MQVIDGSVRNKLTRRHRMMAAGPAGATRGSMIDNNRSGGMMGPTSSEIGSYKPLNPAVNMETGSERPQELLQVEATEDVKTAALLEAGRPIEPAPSSSTADTQTPSASRQQVEPQRYLALQMAALQEIFFSRLNILLVFVPFGLYVKCAEWNTLWIFVTNFLAIIPLASLLGSATEALSSHTGQLLGGLLNATFGNAVEMIMCVQAVKAGLIHVVQGNLLGSILSNLLLVLGMAICASGLLRKTQSFNAQGAAANMTCQAVASISVCLPTMFRAVSGASVSDVLMISRVCSIFLMAVYGLFLYFQLKTHADLFADEGEDEADEQGLSPTFSTVLLIGSTLVVAMCSEALVDSIEGVSETYGLPKAFIGVILLPIVGNAAEHATAVTCAYKGMMDLALGVAVGSSTQIALFVVPCAVMFGWAFDQPMNLAFRDFDTACQMLSVFLVSQVLQHGNTNWLHGAMLMTTYILIAIITWFIPE